MGIFCQINLFKPPDGAYLPGQVVVGLIRYAVDKPMEFERITTSLKGAGLVLLEVRRYKQTLTYRTSQVYVDIDNVVQEEKIEVATGSYDIPFSFILPLNIPSSVHFYKHIVEGTIRCKIKYYIRIKFDRPGMFAFNKRFKQEITVIAGATPQLLREPVIYGETKKLVQLLSDKPNIINIKATIANSVLPVGGKINVQYEVENNSNVEIRSVETKLVERYKFNVKGHREVQKDETVPGTDSKTRAVRCGDTQSQLFEINIPPDRHSLENSHIVSRNYLVRIEAELPLPHRNIVLNIPVQIEIINSNTLESISEGQAEEITYVDPPPLYWENMGEAKKEDEEFEDK